MAATHPAAVRELALALAGYEGEDGEDRRVGRDGIDRMLLQLGHHSSVGSTTAQI